jgi:hypothetical protein
VQAEFVDYCQLGLDHAFISLTYRVVEALSQFPVSYMYVWKLLTVMLEQTVGQVY